MWTLLKANIHRKKGTFISVIIFTTIIVGAMMAMFGVRDNFHYGINRAFEEAETGTMMVGIQEGKLTQDVRKDVEKHPLVGKVNYYEAITTGGTTVGTYKDGNSYFVEEMRENIFLYNENLEGFVEEIPKLSSGEIYLPLGLKTKLHCQVGDVLTMDTLAGDYDFQIKGFVQDPYFGSTQIGWKQVFIGAEDFAKLQSQCRKLEDEEHHAAFVMMEIHKGEDCALSDVKFQRQLNLDTKVNALAHGTLTMAQSIRYTGLLLEVVTNILLVFVGMLFVIVLITMGHSISTEIEIDYRNLGILKSQGFSKERIRNLLLLQYLIAEIIGVILGVMIAWPIERALSKIFMEMTAILPRQGLPVAKSAVGILLILVVSAVVITIKTRKINRISPMRAIAGGKEEIYFDSRFHLPISKKRLSISLTFRQFISNRKRYIGTTLVVALLTFFMVTVNLMGNLLTSRKALDAMGMDMADVEVFADDELTDEEIEEIKLFAESKEEIAKIYASTAGYVSLNGENLYCAIHKYPESIGGILKGRAPLYDNEIIITEMVSEALEIQMGEEVTVSKNEREDTYIVSGIYQSINDSGMVFSMSYEGAEKIAELKVPYMGFVLEKPEKKEKLAKQIQEEFGDSVFVETFDLEKEGIDEQIETAVNAVKVIIYIFSIVFAFVVVRMVCSKSFAQERRDIGIYRAMGFVVGKLRLQFAGRFLVIALLGAAIGMIFSVAFSAKLLGLLLSVIGLVKITADYSFFTILLPVMVVGICFFLFAFVASRKIKLVETRELVVE